MNPCHPWGEHQALWTLWLWNFAQQREAGETSTNLLPNPVVYLVYLKYKDYLYRISRIHQISERAASKLAEPPLMEGVRNAECGKHPSGEDNALVKQGFVRRNCLANTQGCNESCLDIQIKTPSRRKLIQELGAF